MKKLAKIPSFLLTKEMSAALKLEQQSYLIIIPKNILEELDVDSHYLSFDLVILDNKLSLLGPKLINPSVIKSSSVTDIEYTTADT